MCTKMGPFTLGFGKDMPVNERKSVDICRDGSFGPEFSQPGAGSVPRWQNGSMSKTSRGRFQRPAAAGLVFSHNHQIANSEGRTTRLLLTRLG